MRNCKTAPRFVAAASGTFAILIVSASPGKPAEPASTAPLSTTQAACAARYHAGLGEHILPKARALQSIADAMRTPASGLPGRWLFWDGSGVLARTAHQNRLMATPQLDLQSNRLCVRQILMRGGRIRCLDWEPIPAGYEPPEPKPETVDPAIPEISPAERRIAGSLSSRVVYNGAFAELEIGTAFYHIVQRTTDELITYASQPPRGAICSGAGAMVGFYRRQLEPLWQKLAAAKALETETRAAAIATTKAALDEPGKLTSPSNLASLSRDTLAKMLGKDELTPLTAIDAPLTILSEARDVLTDARLDGLPTAVREPRLKALRSIEFASYAAFNAKQWAELGRAFDDALKAITNTHAAACTCSR